MTRESPRDPDPAAPARKASATDRPKSTGIERVAYIVAIVGPLTTVPQITEIYGTKSAEDLSIPAWIGFTLYSAFWMYYGATRKDWPLTLANGLWTALQLVVVIGAIVYR